MTALENIDIDIFADSLGQFKKKTLFENLQSKFNGHCIEIAFNTV